jgi:hypothetical protein
MRGGKGFDDRDGASLADLSRRRLKKENGMERITQGQRLKSLEETLAKMEAREKEPPSDEERERLRAFIGETIEQRASKAKDPIHILLDNLRIAFLPESMITPELSKRSHEVREALGNITVGFAKKAEYADTAGEAGSAPGPRWPMAKAAIVATLAACVLVFFAVRAMRQYDDLAVSIITEADWQLIKSRGAACPPGTDCGSSVPNEKLNLTTAVVTAEAPLLGEVTIKADRKCWVGITDGKGKFVVQRFLGTPALSLIEIGPQGTDWPLTIRSGCPGATHYTLDGREIHPRNEAKNPAIVEIVRIP